LQSGRRENILEQLVSTNRGRQEHTLEDGFVKGRVSIIMPAYNEADCIAKSITATKKQFQSVCEDLEIVVVDDGSTDGTGKLVRATYDSKIKVISYDRNKGKGYALKEGFNYVTGEFSFLVDSDLEIHAKELTAYIEALEAADIVIGSKRHPLSSVETPILRRFLSLGFNMLERLLTGVQASDTQAGLKGARSSSLYRVLPLLSVKRYAFDAELLAVSSLLGLRIKELPVYVKLSATFSAREILRMLIDLLGITYRIRVKRWYQKNIKKASNTYKPIISW
jgi:glycosyltransferase involved in cell wall biosynthesis